MTRTRPSPPSSVAGAVLRHVAWLGWTVLVAATCVVAPSAARAQSTLPAAPSAAAEPAADAADALRAAAPLSQFPPMRTPASQPAAALEDAPEVLELYRAARELVEDGRYDRAVEKLDEALRIARQDYFEVLHLMAWAKYRLERFGEARSAAEYAVILRPDSADAHFLLGLLYRRQNVPERAIGHLRTATLLADRDLNNPRITAAFYELADCLLAEGYLAAAAECYERFDERVWDSFPEHREDEFVQRVLERHPRGLIDATLDLYRRLGRADEAVRAAAAAARLRPDDAYVAQLHLRALLDAGRHPEAFEAARARLTPPATPHPGFVRLAVEAGSAAGLLDGWCENLRAAAGDAESGALVRTVATELGAAGLHAQAVALWEALAAAHPADADLVWSLAAAQRAAGRLREAVDALIRFMRAHPDVLDLPQGLLANWMRRLDDADALPQLISTYGEAGRTDAATAFVLGSLAAGAGFDTLAEELFRASLSARADFAPARLAWGEMLLRSYRWAEAAEHAAAIVELHPRNAAAQFLLARARAGLDDNAAAEKAFEAALRYAPGESRYALALAQHHWRRFRTDGSNAALLAAQRYFQEALALAPGDPEAFEGLINSYVAGGKIDIARSRLSEAEERGAAPDALRRARTTLQFLADPSPERYLAELERQRAEFPDDLPTALKLAEAYQVRDRVEDALRVLEQVRAAAPDDEELLRMLARARVQNLEYEEAARLLERLAGMYPNRVAVLGYLAAVLHSDLRMQDARRVLERLLALDLAPEDRNRFRLGMLETWRSVREFDPALAYLDEWIAQQPQEDGLVLERIRTLYLAGRHSDAATAADAWVAAAPDDDRRRERRGLLIEVALRAPDYKLAERLLRALLDESPGNVGLATLLAETLSRDGRPEEGLALLEGVKAETYDAQVRLEKTRAQCQADARRGEAAAEALTALLEDPKLRFLPLEPNATRRQLLQVLLDAGRIDRALEWCDRWLADAGDDAPARAVALDAKRGVLQRAGRTDEYIEVMQRLLELLPDDPGIHNDLGYTWVDRGEHVSRATRMIRRAVAAEPLNPSFLDSLGWAYYKAGDFAAARKYLERSLRVLGGEDPVVYDHLGDALFRLADHDGARRAWRRAVELIENEGDRPEQPGRAELLSAVRAKLDALDGRRTPPVAPTAQPAD